MARRRGFKFWLGVLGGALGVLAVAALLIWRDDILVALLDPKIPYSVYRPPPRPDYAKSASWALLPATAEDGRPVDVFFIHPTTFDGGKDWNGPILDKAAARLLDRVMLPNYAAPFASTGRVFAPRYRQSSLYTSMTLFDDAIEAREFAYSDVRDAFRYYRAHLDDGRPFVLVGVEQGGVIAERLLRDEVETDPSLRARLVAAYLIETAAPADAYAPGSGVPACASPAQTGCALAWVSVGWADLGRALRIARRAVTWNAKGHLVGLGDHPILCANPLLGRVSDADAPPRLNLGSANATNLEWGVHPGFLARQVGARCVRGVLRVSTARSLSLRPSGGWANRFRVRGYNVFWANLERDVATRWAAFARPRAAATGAAPPGSPHPARATAPSDRQSKSS